MSTRNVYTKVKNCFFILCFTIINKMSYVQITARKINQKYRLSRLFPFFLKPKTKSENFNNRIQINDSTYLISENIDNRKYYKMMFRDKDDENKIVPCNFSFTSINIICDEKEYDIDICGDKFNFLCENNIINHDFLKWYLYYFNHVDISNNYKLSIIDDECEMLEVEKGKTIVLNEDKYTIV